jgi:hypothetical protein
VRRLPHQLDDAGAPHALGHRRHAAVRQPQRLQDARDDAHLVHAVGTGLLLLGVLLQHQEEVAVVRLGLGDDLARRRLVEQQRHHQVRERRRLAQREHEHRVGQGVLHHDRCARIALRRAAIARAGLLGRRIRSVAISGQVAWALCAGVVGVVRSHGAPSTSGVGPEKVAAVRDRTAENAGARSVARHRATCPTFLPAPVEERLPGEDEARALGRFGCMSAHHARVRLPAALPAPEGVASVRVAMHPWPRPA